MGKKYMGYKKNPVFIFIFICLVACFTILVTSGSNKNAEARTIPFISEAPGSFSELVKGARHSVVNISTVKVIKRRGVPFRFGRRSDPNDPFGEFFERFFGEKMPKKFKQRSLGTGFIIDKEGFILTNNHVVENTDEIKVKFDDGKEFEAKIVGRDPKTDLALIRIDTDRSLEALPLGDSEKLEVGDWVVAIGNPFGLGNTVTAGIVSAKYRNIGAGTYDNFIQTDASINPGSSGGPLLNTSGEVIGINTAIFSRSGGNIGIGFAIPINMAKDIIPQLRTKGKVVRGWLGVMVQQITPELKEKLGLEEEKGALVANVTKGGPAEKAGIKRGDVITAFGKKEINMMKELPLVVAATPVGKAIPVTVIRDGEKKIIKVKIEEMKSEETAVEASQEKPDLGLTVEEFTPEQARRFGLPETTGLVVTNVESYSPAAESGLKRGDVILEIDREPMRTIEEFNKKMMEYNPGSTILFLIMRGQATLYLTVNVPD
ncbi:DegQ family serine endoprotease [Thermodesulfobacteriota bacterium]